MPTKETNKTHHHHHQSHHKMPTLPSLFSSSCHRQTSEELEYCTEGSQTTTTLGSLKGFRRRILQSRRSCSQPSRGPWYRRGLMAESKVMLRKNQTWLTTEDPIATPTSLDDTPKSSPPVDGRTGNVLKTIPDLSPLTLNRGLQRISDTHPTVPQDVTPVVSPSTTSFPKDGEDFFGNSGSCLLESSGTLTPSSDTNLSRGASIEVLPTSPSPSSSFSSSQFFALRRGDSMEGLCRPSHTFKRRTSIDVLPPTTSLASISSATSAFSTSSSFDLRHGDSMDDIHKPSDKPLSHHPSIEIIPKATSSASISSASSAFPSLGLKRGDSMDGFCKPSGKPLSHHPSIEVIPSATSSASISSAYSTNSSFDLRRGDSVDGICKPPSDRTFRPGPSVEVLRTASSSASSSYSFFDLRRGDSVDGICKPSDKPLRHNQSIEVLPALAPSTSSCTSSPSFTMHRGDSVDGLFMSSLLDTTPPPEDITPIQSKTRQSPFRRQLYTSFLTRQSALVSRVTDHSWRLLGMMNAVTRFTHASTKQPTPSGTQETPLQSNQNHTSNLEVDEGTTTSIQLRSSNRQQSICDSGLGCDTDDDLTSSTSVTSLSCSSTYTASETEDGEEYIDEVLCGNRVSQMTKTYNDIDAVTRLLQEKEKDLELAAKIGQQLLNRNKALEERNNLLDSELSSATDTITQLKHDLQMKTDLLQIYTNDVDESSCETTPTSIRNINVEFLQHRIRNLEDENRSLHSEAKQIAFDTEACEDKEKELMTDVIKQLSEANHQVSQLSDEVAKKVEDSLRQQEEITQLLAQVVDLQSRNKRLMGENDELANMVGVARDCQQELTMELAELKEKYAEVLDLLHDTQDQLRRVQKKNLPGSRGHLSSGLFSSPFNSGGNDSIASELQSLGSSGDEHGKGRSSNMTRTFDTVRLSGKHSGLGSQGSLNSLGYGGSLHSTPTHHPHTPSHLATSTHMTSSGSGYAVSYLSSRGSSVYSGGSGHPSLDSGADSDASMHTDSEDNYPGSHIGVPGWPGTPDLDSCLRRLAPADRSGTPSQFLPYGCRTPDSIMSTGSIKSGVSGYGSNASDWKLPQKLQIVKPIEGSLTLHQWSRLATPHLGGLLEEREGVAIKGGMNTDLNLEVYSMSDLEEDEVEEENPGKRFMSTSGVFTYTNSTVLHPDDQTTSTPSVRQAQVSVLPTSLANTSTTPSTPIRAPSCPASRRGSTATFSVNTGLAKVLNERGMNQQSAFSPTATPANSPSASRPGSPEPEGYKLPGLEDLTKTFYYGASLLRRTFYKNDPSAPQSPTGPRVNLVEQVQAIGVDRFVGLSGGALTVGGVVTSRPATSPLLHLSNLIMSSAKGNTTTTTAAAANAAKTTTTDSGNRPGATGVSSPPKVMSPGERRPTLPSGAPMGIPGHPGSGHLDNRLTQLKPGQRADLGTVGGRPRPTSLGTVPSRGGSGVDMNVGTVGWTSFGRKGGLL